MTAAGRLAVVRGTSMSDLSAGEVGGVFAGAIALLAAVGKAIAWVLDWQGARDKAKAQRLEAWEASLDRRERDYREDIERDLEQLRAQSAAQAAELARMREQQAAIGFSLLEVTLELRANVPASPALVRIGAVLRRVFQPEHGIPPEVGELLRALDDADQMASRR